MRGAFINLMISLVKISKSVYIYNNFASHGKYYHMHTNSYAQNILSLRFIFFLVQIKYSIDKNQLRLSGEEERNDKIKRKMTTALRILKKIKLLKRKLIF